MQLRWPFSGRWSRGMDDRGRGATCLYARTLAHQERTVLSFQTISPNAPVLRQAYDMQAT